MNHLRGVVGFVLARWFVKAMKDGQAYILEMAVDTLVRALKGYKPLKGNGRVSIAQVVSLNSQLFRYDDIDRILQGGRRQPVPGLQVCGEHVKRLRTAGAPPPPHPAHRMQRQ